MAVVCRIDPRGSFNITAPDVYNDEYDWEATRTEIRI